ncbi:hypothetical protein Tsubulata_039720 [Turnera subulata]|uniref:Peptidase C1A papain C-terminal domain-containing protein n=1 Tax=Turnera subulata TaxID=218843 RepID=A0A9Q0FI87_9ROSI|nr:hypothetical protein Tsubulata_039720 [Turnera subulata]
MAAAQNEDVTLFSWKNCKTVDGKDIIPKARKQETADTCPAYAISAYMQIVYRLTQTDNKVSEENWVEDLSAKQIIDIMTTIGSTEIKKIFDYLIKEKVLPLTDKEYDGQRQRLPYPDDPRRVFTDSVSIFGMAGLNWSSSRICREIFKHGAVIGVIPICSDFFDKAITEGTDIYKARKVLIRDGKFQKHAVVIIGWGRRGETFYWEFLNSFGDEWGKGGVGKVEMRAVLEIHFLRIAKHNIGKRSSLLATPVKDKIIA